MANPSDASDPSRRDFLYISSGVVAAVGVVAVAWPMIDQMNPDAGALAVATTDVDVSSIQPGMSITIKWQGKPVFIRNRTPEEVEGARRVALADLRDRLARNANLPDNAPASDENRATDDSLIILVGICTHLGCVPLGQQGNYGGWFCPCHGSHYDAAGRIREGPAPENLAIPRIAFLSDSVVRIG